MSRGPAVKPRSCDVRPVPGCGLLPIRLGANWARFEEVHNDRSSKTPFATGALSWPDGDCIPVAMPTHYSSVSVSALAMIWGASDSRIALSAVLTQRHATRPSVTIASALRSRTSSTTPSKYLSLTPHPPCIKIVQDQDLPQARSPWSSRASPLRPNCARLTPPRLRALPGAQQSASLFASLSSTSSASSSSAPTEPF